MEVRVIVRAIDNSPATCDAGEESEPTKITLRMVDDNGDVLISNGKTRVCKFDDGEANIKRAVFFNSPLNCEGGVPPYGGSSLGIIESTGSTFTVPGGFPTGVTPYEEDTQIKCFN